MLSSPPWSLLSSLCCHCTRPVSLSPMLCVCVCVCVCEEQSRPPVIRETDSRAWKKQFMALWRKLQPSATIGAKFRWFRLLNVLSARINQPKRLIGRPLLTIHSKHAICHKSLNSQNSLSLSLSPTRHCCCHSSADVPPISSCYSTTKLAAWTLLWQKLIITVSSWTRHKENVMAMFVKKCVGHYLLEMHQSGFLGPITESSICWSRYCRSPITASNP